MVRMADGLDSLEKSFKGSKLLSVCWLRTILFWRYKGDLRQTWRQLNLTLSLWSYSNQHRVYIFTVYIYMYIVGIYWSIYIHIYTYIYIYVYTHCVCMKCVRTKARLKEKNTINCEGECLESFLFNRLPFFETQVVRSIGDSFAILSEASSYQDLSLPSFCAPTSVWEALYCS